ncbi:MAG: radical SAM protein [Bacteroidales bacterium]|jgi:wyosine [tRNA(Phe)-imidazoG37] synthetase (radical SAM superfamily)
MTFLFDRVVFGPVHSRRLGVSLGINLLPAGYKHCSFNCIYCECGWTKIIDNDKVEFPPVSLIKEFLEKKLAEMQANNELPDAISFAGNGEPTLHPDFAEIIDITIKLRNNYSPKSKIAVLSNASMLHLPAVVSALKKIDQNILKLDAGTEETFRNINNPVTDISLETIVRNLRQFKSNLIIQTLFIRGEYKGKIIDNTTEKEVNAWLKYIKELNPEMVMIYPIARDTPVRGLEKIGLNELEAIAEKVRGIGVKAEVYY